ncbi:hypothetical protein [Aliivibrio fischeri]|uniref:hypothetical protein n=1 Tax=Aliivibrio fischeri TaxID=668 RepID=UPI0012D90BF8|nr:hypothetical protein [Aliivibrio fischeri]MUJ20461.1 hypothetical protein [Aliivibrio fischeri]
MNNHSIKYDEWERLIELNTVIANKWSVITKLALELMVHAGLRTSEIALLKIGDLLSSDYQLKRVLIVPAAISYNGKDRPVFLKNKSLIKSLMIYFELIGSLQDHDISTTSPLLLKPNSVKGFDVHKRGRKANGQPKYHSAALNEFIDHALSKLVINEVHFTRKSLINTFVCNSYRYGYSIEEISLMSGLCAISVRKIVTNNNKSHSDFIDWWLRQLKSNTVRSNVIKAIPFQSIINEIKPCIIYPEKDSDYEIKR